MAYVAALAGDRNRAIDLSTQAIAFLQQDAELSSALLLRSSLLRDNNQFEAALRDIDEVVRLDPRDARARESRAVTFFQMKRYEDALNDYDAVSDIKPHEPVGYLGRAMVMARLGNLAGARAALTKALNNTSDDPEIHLTRAKISHDLSDYSAAIDDFTAAIKHNPFESYFRRALSYSALGNFDAAVEDLRRAIELRPAHPEAHFNLGKAYSDSGHYQQAIKSYSQAITLKNTYASAFTNRGFAYQKLNQIDRALQDYEASLQLDPHAINTYRNRGWLYEQQGNFASAASDYERCIAIGDGDEWAKRALARVKRMDQ